MAAATGLADPQLRALDRLSRVPALASFYLADGTAIAFHVGHRRSLDIDLFSLSADADLDAVRRGLDALETDLEVLAQTDAVLKVLIDREPVDIVRYRYPPLDSPSVGPSGILVASLRDLAVMKLAAVARRGIRRDFWDLRAIVETGLSLNDIARAYTERFGASEADLYHVARALTYFDDAEKDPAYPAGLDDRAWTEIKRFFVRVSPTMLGARA